jgi:hypothetical protein
LRALPSLCARLPAACVEWRRRAAARERLCGMAAAALRGDTIALVFGRLEAADDLLHASRVCREWRRAVAGDACEPVWAALCRRHGYACRPGGGPAREQFRQR